jgi:copper transporter 1
MLFTWDTTNLCIVFRGWRITGTGSLIVSLLAIVLMTAGYEAVREASRRYEAYAGKLNERRGEVRGESCISYTYSGIEGRRFRHYDLHSAAS